MMYDRRLMLSFDWISFLLMLVLLSIGLVCIFSATYNPVHPYSLFFKKQLFGVVSGIVIYFICCIADYRTLQRYGFFLYIGILGLLIYTIIKGSVGMGAQRWINVGLFKFQPSELVKLFFPSFFSYYLMTEKSPDDSLKTYGPLIGILALSAVLIRKQPDLGTAVIIFFSGVLLLWVAGLRKQYFIWAFVLSTCGAPLLWHILRPYQKQRILVFFGHGNTRKEGYQIEQSRIAVGSGGLRGKGFLEGTQNRLRFLPESRTDFIFSVLAEEWGFIGTIIVLVLYILLFMRLFFVILTIHDQYMQLLAFGLVIPIALAMLVNIGMVIGLLPVVGIPLPFMTYGISHTWITCASLGLLNGIISRRFMFISR